MPSRIQKARRDRDQASALFNQLVVLAHQQGQSMASIAHEAGISRQRVWKIIQTTPVITPAPRRLVKLERRNTP